MIRRQSAALLTAVKADQYGYALQHISVHMRSSGICGVYLLRAEESCSFGSEYSAYLVTVEQGDQLVGHAKLPTFQCWRYHGFNSFKLLRWISPQIDFGRLNIIMPQPQRHLPDIPRGLQHQHGTGMPQDMRGD